jgi:hypothetical protein
MTKVGNILAKGATVAAHVLVGSIGFGFAAISLHWTPPPSTNPLLQTAWFGIGASLLGGASAALMRWAKFDPSKLGK